jgi:branched-chain amino acid transport system substrate-binding protein
MKNQLAKLLSLSAFFLLTFPLFIGLLFPCSLAAEGNPIKVGALFSLSGWAASGGKPELQGAQLAVEEINAQGGVKGSKIELVVEDNRSDYPSTISAFNKLANVDKVQVLLGPNWTEFGELVSPLAQRNKLPTLLISGLSVRPPQSKPYLLGLLPHFSEHVRELSTYIQSKGFKRVQIVFSPTIYFEGMTEALLSELRKHKIEVLPPQLVQAGNTEFKSLLGRMQTQKPDAYVVFLQEGSGMANFMNQLRLLKISTPVLSHDIKFDHTVSENPKVAEGVVFLHYVLRAEDSFITRYQARFKELPSITSPRAYDAIFAIKQALTDCSLPSIRECLYAVDLQGAAGRMRFNADGSLVDVPQLTELWTVTNGAFTKLQ